MPGYLAPTTRMIDLVHTLPDPVDFIHNILGNFVAHGYDPEADLIRLGITGRGVRPNYKIEKPSSSRTLVILSSPNIEFNFTFTPAHTFNGRNHREMTNLVDLERRDENWSNATATGIELKDLLTNLSQSMSKH